MRDYLDRFWNTALQSFKARAEQPPAKSPAAKSPAAKSPAAKSPAAKSPATNKEKKP